MNCEEKTLQLRRVLEGCLLPLVGHKCILLDAPYHVNIGDLLIWEGERQFIERNGIELLYTRSCDTFDFGRLAPDVTILLHGGGNFGDVWRYFQEFRLRVIEAYPTNRIVVLPQSVEYSVHSLMENDAKIMSHHKDLHICVRDAESRALVEANFSNPCLLLPDMAFCIDSTWLREFATKREEHADKALLVKRLDKEADESVLPVELEAGCNTGDWPTFEHSPLCYEPKRKLGHWASVARRHGVTLLAQAFRRMEDHYMANVCKPMLIKKGVHFLAPYGTIYTTRLHVAILSVLLGKEHIYMMDNSYGKNRRFYRQWLSDVDSVSFFGEE